MNLTYLLSFFSKSKDPLLYINFYFKIMCTLFICMHERKMIPPPYVYYVQYYLMYCCFLHSHEYTCVVKLDYWCTMKLTLAGMIVIGNHALLFHALVLYHGLGCILQNY